MIEDQAAELGPMPVTLEQMTPWPFTEGPYGWPVYFGQQGESEIQAAGLALFCGHRRCNQAITRLGAWGHTLAALKPQIAAHVMQCHSDVIGC